MAHKKHTMLPKRIFSFKSFRFCTLCQRVRVCWFRQNVAYAMLIDIDKIQINVDMFIRPSVCDKYTWKFKCRLKNCKSVRTYSDKNCFFLLIYLLSLYIINKLQNMVKIRQIIRSYAAVDVISGKDVLRCSEVKRLNI